MKLEESQSFGQFLKVLIQSADMTHLEFYTSLGIKKPYFYDILSGRTNPPPPELQFKAMEILNADEETKEHFFDLAARGRGEIPADIAKWIQENQSAATFIREEMHRVV